MSTSLTITSKEIRIALNGYLRRMPIPARALAEKIVNHLLMISNFSSITRRNEMVRNSKSREIPGNLLSDFATETLMGDPEKVFPGQGPKNSHKNEMIWATIGNIQGIHLPMYEYLQGEQYKEQYDELENGRSKSSKNGRRKKDHLIRGPMFHKQPAKISQIEVLIW